MGVLGPDLTASAHDERAEFADLLDGLSPGQWQTPSLCAGWRVHDVVAHVVSYDELGAAELARRFAAARLVPDRANALGVEAYRGRTPEELVATLRAQLVPRGLTAGFGGAIALADAVIHQQDVRRPLGLPRRVPPERLVPALWLALFAPVVRGIGRVFDLRLVAEDLDWTFGRGPAVHAPAETLLMALAGRGAVADELSGPGVARLAARLRG